MLRGALDALRAAFTGAAISKEYFLAMFEDEAEAEAMFNMHENRVKCAAAGKAKGR